MSAISNIARLYWTFFQESQEAILHGNPAHAVEICYDLVLKPDLPLLLGALARLTLAQHTDIRRNSAADKRRWILEAREIKDLLGANPDCGTEDVAFLDQHIQSATQLVEAEIAKAFAAIPAPKKTLAVAPVPQKGKVGSNASPTKKDQMDIRMTKGAEELGERLERSKTPDDDDSVFVDASEEPQGSPESAGSRMSGIQATIGQILGPGDETDTESVAGKGLLPKIPMHLKPSLRQYLPTPQPSSDPAAPSSDNEDVEMGGTNGSQGNGGSSKGSML